MYSEYVAERQMLGMIVDASENGLRVQRLLRGPNAARVIQLEFELPGTNEIIWAKGELAFDSMWRGPPGSSAPLVRTSGVKLVAAAERHLRLLRDFVRERLVGTRAPPEDEPVDVRASDGHWLLRAAHFH
jgi:hypothetical protein